jgi:lipoprotein-anchoring transpeptidase ErfK/SrfK
MGGGKPASPRGCVRMFNWAIRRFSRTVPDGTLVLIRA